MKYIYTKYFLVGLFSLYYFALLAQIPVRPEPPRLVNDFANILSPEQQNNLERLLVEFNDSTSNQIAIVTVNNLGNYDKAQFAYEIGEQWGIGQAKVNNGVVILIKPKTADERGEVFIAPGYGLESVLPDAICRRIEENHMIPHFRENDYYGGIMSALSVILPLAKGEYAVVKENAGDEAGALATIVFVIFIIIVFVIINKNGPKNMSGRGRSGDFWTGAMLGGMLGRGSSGSWGGFSGGGGGGFGGFGGGSFGGGGAGGSW